MSKEAWFQELERLDTEMANGEIPQMSEMELADAAHEAMVDRFADAVDMAWDMRKERGP